MAAWKRVACGSRDCTFDRGKLRIKDPRARDTKGNFQCLDAKSRREICECQLVGKRFVQTPVKNADISTFKDDIIYIDEVIEKFKKMKSNKISELTHTKLWQSLNNGDEMPVEVASSEKYVDNNIDIKW